MAQPRFAFWLSLATAVWIAAVSLSGGLVAALLGLPLAAGCLVAAANASREEPRAPRRVVGAGAGALVFALVHLAAGGGLGAVASLALAAALVGAGARLSLERMPVARERPPRNTRSPSLAFAVATDELLRLYWDATGRLDPRGGAGFVAERLRGAAARNRARGFLDDPAAAHPVPPALEKPDVSRVALRGLGSVEHLRFESEYEPYDAEVRDGYLALRASRIAHAWLWRHADGPRPAIILVHGYSSGRPALDARAFDVERLHRRLGLDVALFALPLHGLRAEGRRSGAGFFDGDPLWTGAALGQAVWDLRRLAGWLRASGAPLVGVMGSSLGGATAALFASLDGRLACAVPHIPAADLAKIVWSQLAPARRRALEAAGASEALFEEAWAPVSPLRHRPRVAQEGRLLVAAAADRICTPEHARALHQRWEGCAIHWFPGSHTWPLGRGGARLRIEAHLRQTLVVPASAQGAGAQSAGPDAQGGRAVAQGTAHAPPDLPLSRFRRSGSGDGPR